MKDIIKKLYFLKLNKELYKGLQNGTIQEFDDELYSILNKTLVSTIPVDLHIKYLKPTLPPGKCYDRSLYMFFALDDSVLVRGDLKDLEYEYGKEDAGHGWIEMNGYVYDPTSRLRYEKDVYYKLFKPTNVEKCTHEEYNNTSDENRYYYERIKNTTRDTFKEEGSERMSLAMTIPLLVGIAEHSDEFKEALKVYLKEINYDEAEIFGEIEDEYDKLLHEKRLFK